MVNWNKTVYPIIVEQLKILNDQGIVPTLRSMYYRLLSLGVFDNGPKYADKALSERTATWRKNSIPELRKHRHETRRVRIRETGEYHTRTTFEERRKMKHFLKLPIDCFADDTRNVVRTWNDYKAPDTYLEERINDLLSFSNDYTSKIPRWYGQQHYCEIWVEKKAMIGTIEHILGDRQVRIVPLSGYSSVPYMHDNMSRLEDNVVMRGSHMVHILFAGDLDPSGEDIKHNVISALANYELTDHIDFTHIGVTEQQVEKWKLLFNPSPEKISKLENAPRAKRFKASRGELYQYEIDSLPTLVPDEFKSLILNPIDKWFDNKIYDEVRSDKIYSEEELKKLQKEVITKLYNEIIGKDTQS